MKYYLIAGEASGGLHASHQMAALKAAAPRAEFRFFGGDMMEAVGGTLVTHYRNLAYMGFIPVLLHARTILRGMARCKEDIVQWKPDVVILVDYPGFNLRIARFVKKNTRIPVFYYISPKIWAWKEHRIKDIRRYVDELFSILPFEKDFFEKKHHYPIHYVGNPTVDEVYAYKAANQPDFERFCADNGLDSRPVIALLAGSRKQEIKDNLKMMAEAANCWSEHYQTVVAAAPGIDDDFYHKCLGDYPATILRGQTYRILQHALAALVTSGTATLETALFRVPQVVCYYMKAGRLANWGKKLFLKVKYVSLVNLVAGREVVPELVAADMTPDWVYLHLLSILPGGSFRRPQMEGCDEVARLLGEPGAPQHAARLMTEILKQK